MTVTEKLAHAAERKAFETMLDSLIRKSRTQDVGKVADDLVSMVQKIHSSVWEPETFAMLHKIANDPNSKWAHYAERLLRECDPYLLRTFLTAAAYEGGFRGFQQARANSEKYDCNIPWIVLMDPTSACNMRCAGCWAAEYGYKQNLTFEEMDRVLTEGAALGTHACLFTGGEPLMRKADIFRLCEKHRDMAFHAFTNGTLIDEDFCKTLCVYPNLCPQFHLSLQSGCTATLRRMRRVYTAQEYAQVVEQIRAAYGSRPVSFTTDCICGFPGETAEDFEESCAFLKKIGFVKVHVFPYSRRSGTPAYDFPDQIHEREKQERSRRMNAVAEQVRCETLAAFEGTEDEVLLETPLSGTLFTGYTRLYIPVVVSAPGCESGQIVRVKLGRYDGERVRAALC